MVVDPWGWGGGVYSNYNLEPIGIDIEGGQKYDTNAVWGGLKILQGFFHFSDFIVKLAFILSLLTYVL